MGTTRFGHPALSAVLRTASELLHMEVVLLAAVSADRFVAERVHLAGTWPGVTAGLSVPAEDALCARLLSGVSSSATSRAQDDPEFNASPLVAEYGIRSYVGVPIRDGRGRVLGTLCGVDRGAVDVTEQTLAVLRELAATVSELLTEQPADLVIRRLPEGGWEVCGHGGGVTSDLTSAMVLADLLAGELAPGARPQRPDGPLDEVAALKLAVGQLEHALAARVLVEQALGVLTERQHHSPRDAFERLRKAARSRGRKVHDLAREVVLSAQDGAVPLPPELAGRR